MMLVIRVFTVQMLAQLINSKCLALQLKTVYYYIRSIIWTWGGLKNGYAFMLNDSVLVCLYTHLLTDPNIFANISPTNVGFII